MSGSHVIDLSAAWLPPDAADERGGWVRRFGMPAGLEPDDRVWLVVVAANRCRITFGGSPPNELAAGEPWRRDIAGFLRPRNELVLFSDSPVAGGSGRRPLPETVARVWLEIEAAERPAPS